MDRLTLQWIVPLSIRNTSIFAIFYTNGITSAGIFDVCKTSNGRIWVATMDGLRYYDAKYNVFRKIGHQLLDHVFIYSLLRIASIACGRQLLLMAFSA